MSWTLGSSAVLLVALCLGVVWYERSAPSSKTLALVGTLAALATLGRMAFAPLPDIKPTTDIVLITGYVLGGGPGFMVGAVAALASNVFFGEGPWTPWQMVAWGVTGLMGAGLARLAGRRVGRWPLAVTCALAGVAFGTIMNTFTWTATGTHSLGGLATIASVALPFDLAHALGNLAFALAFGPALAHSLQRLRDRMDVRWVPTLTTPAAALLAALTLAAGTGVAQLASPQARAAARAHVARAPDRATARVTAYLLGSQNRDGGFGGAAGGSSSELYTAWAAIGLAAAGHPPSSVRHAAHSVSDYLLATAAGASATGDLERTILALSAARVSARHAAGRDLVSALVRRRSADGSFSEQANLTAFAILALRAAGRPARDAAVRGAARWLAGQANRDGGFGFGARGGTSDNDDSAAAVQALVVAGHRTGPVRAALRFIAAHENRDGGFPLTPGESSNAQSTAWAAQALVATGGDPGRARAGFSRSPLGYLRSLVAADGSVRYSRTSRQTPVWVSAQALTALTRTALPVVAPRGKRPSRRRVTGARARPAPGGTAARPSRRPGVGAHRRATGPAVGHPRRLGAMLREAGALAGLVLAPVLGGAEGGDGARSASAHPAKR